MICGVNEAGPSVQSIFLGIVLFFKSHFFPQGLSPLVAQSLLASAYRSTNASLVFCT
jgi:hypothetical protein